MQNEFNISYNAAILGFFLCMIGIVFIIHVMKVSYVISNNKIIHLYLNNHKCIAATSFLNEWKSVHSKNKYLTGYMVNDTCGCYVLLTYSSPIEEIGIKNFDDIHIGKSIRMCHRVYQHFTGRGNEKIYRAIKENKNTYVVFYPCLKNDLEEMEYKLKTAFLSIKKQTGNANVQRENCI